MVFYKDAVLRSKHRYKIRQAYEQSVYKLLLFYTIYAQGES